MNDTVVFLVLAGLALVYKWLTRQASNNAEAPKPPRPNEPRPVQRAPAQSDEEKVRRFLEALGAPPGTRPPSPVRPRSVVPRPAVTPPPPAQPRKVKRSWVQPLPPLTTFPPGPMAVEAAPPPPVIVAPPPQPEPVKVLQPSTPLPRKTALPSVTPLGSLGEMLRSARTARQAIMLREVLGPPLGLRTLEELRGF